MDRTKIIGVWADEPGLQLVAERLENGKVRVWVLEVESQRRLAEVTLGSWRWDRLVRAVSEESANATGKEG